MRSRLSEFQCPYCRSQLVGAVEAPVDHDEKHWDSVRTFECGYQDFGGAKQRLCPNDPEFPKFDEYELMYTEQNSGAPYSKWICSALPRTAAARLVPLPQTIGPTQKGAADEMVRECEEREKPWMRPVGELP